MDEAEKMAGLKTAVINELNSVFIGDDLFRTTSFGDMHRAFTAELDNMRKIYKYRQSRWPWGAVAHPAEREEWDKTNDKCNELLGRMFVRAVVPLMSWAMQANGFFDNIE